MLIKIISITSQIKPYIGYCIWLVILIYLAYPYVIDKHFQADEFQNTYNIEMLNYGDMSNYFNNLKPIMIPLSWLLDGNMKTHQILTQMRVVFFIIFIINLFLISELQPYFEKRTHKLLLLLVITFSYVFWQYGFEIRHDVVIELGLIISYGLIQALIKKKISNIFRNSTLCFFLGFTICFLSLTSYKGLAYGGLVSILSLLLLIITDKSISRTIKHILIVVAGFSISLLLHLLIIWKSGYFYVFINGYMSFFTRLDKVIPFSPIEIYRTLLYTSPIISIFSCYAIYLYLANTIRTKTLLFNNTFVTFTFFIISTFLLFLNPTPYSYNSILVFPFIIFLGIDGIYQIKNNIHFKEYIGILLLTIIFYLNSWHQDFYLKQSNALQLIYISIAEKLTDNESHVLDGVGIVLSRKPIDQYWQLHSAYMDDYYAKKRTSFIEIMKKKSPTVIITNYRWTWLNKLDIEYLNQNYLKVHKHFWLLGKTIKEPSGSLIIKKEGRYLFTKAVKFDKLTIDGKNITKNPLYLNAGVHEYNYTGLHFHYHWIGENLDSFPQISPGVTETILIAGFPSSKIYIGL